MARLTIPVQLRWSDLDAYGHVNNVAMLTLLEEARIEAFWRRPDAPDGVGAVRTEDSPTAVLDGGPGATTTTLIARSDIEYLRPLDYRRELVIVELWIGHLGGASIDVCYEVHDGGEPFARATTTVVLVDAASGAPRRMSADERAAWLPYLEAPVELRRRRG